MATDTIRGELAEYSAEFAAAKQRLVDYQLNHQSHMTSFSTANVLETAVDGLLGELRTPDLAETIDLSRLNALVEKVDNVRLSIGQFFSRRTVPIV